MYVSVCGAPDPQYGSATLSVPVWTCHSSLDLSPQASGNRKTQRTHAITAAFCKCFRLHVSVVTQALWHSKGDLGEHFSRAAAAVFAMPRSKKKGNNNPPANQNTGTEWMLATANRLGPSKSPEPEPEHEMPQEKPRDRVAALQRAVSSQMRTTAKASSPAVFGGSSGSGEPVAPDPDPPEQQLARLVAETPKAVLRGAAQAEYRFEEGMSSPSFQPSSHTRMVDGRPVQVPQEN